MKLRDTIPERSDWSKVDFFIVDTFHREFRAGWATAGVILSSLEPDFRRKVARDLQLLGSRIDGEVAGLRLHALAYEILNLGPDVGIALTLHVARGKDAVEP